VVSLVEVMAQADDEIALARCIRCPGDLALLSVLRLDPAALDAVVGAEQPLRKRPEAGWLVSRSSAATLCLRRSASAGTRLAATTITAELNTIQKKIAITTPKPP
jgi:hypothetical protein